MGVGISNWALARAVARAGQEHGVPVLGVVSGTGLPILLASRLRQKDQQTAQAIATFPVPAIAEELLRTYYGTVKQPPKPQVLMAGNAAMVRRMNILAMASNYVEVRLAQQGHTQPIGINYLEKIQLTHLPEIYGAMLAGVDYILMGAGIPNQVPEVIRSLAGHQSASYLIDVAGDTQRYKLSFDPAAYIPAAQQQPLTKPRFLAIVSSHVLAQALATKVTGVDGFVVEGPAAGGHNAPPRGKELTETGEPKYGPKDQPDLAKIAGYGKPFWLAGGFASPQRLAEAKALGAAGIQAGSVFALCEDSGLRPDLRRAMRQRVCDGTLGVTASPTASPTGFPFQVAALDGTLSEPETYAARKRVCREGYLVQPVRVGEDIVFRCPAEPVDAYLKKGGKVEDTAERRCICVGLCATAGHAGASEAPIVTIGKDVSAVWQLLAQNHGAYTAEDVIVHLFGLHATRRDMRAPALDAAPPA